MYALILHIMLTTATPNTIAVVGPITVEQCMSVATQRQAHDGESVTEVRCEPRAEAVVMLASHGCTVSGPNVAAPGYPEARDSFWVCGLSAF